MKITPKGAESPDLAKIVQNDKKTDSVLNFEIGSNKGMTQRHSFLFYEVGMTPSCCIIPS